MNEPLTPAQRSMRARIAAHASWAKTTDPTARTAAARRAAVDRFERQVDPDGVLPAAERRRRAAAAEKAYMTGLAYRSSRARQRAKAAETARKETTMSTPNPAEVWRRIVAHAGETFTQVRGGQFTYAVVGDYLDLDRTNQRIPRAHLEEALTLVPLPNTVAVHHLRAPSYVFAILMDDRIRRSDW